jgi:hypothetical protein
VVVRGGQLRERSCESIVVAAERRRELPQQRAELRRLVERLDPLEQQ